MLDKEKLEPYTKIILAGSLPAIAIIFIQWVLTWNCWFLGGLIVFLVFFAIVSYFYLTKKGIDYNQWHKDLKKHE